MVVGKPHLLATHHVDGRWRISLGERSQTDAKQTDVAIGHENRSSKPCIARAKARPLAFLPAVRDHVSGCSQDLGIGREERFPATCPPSLLTACDGCPTLWRQGIAPLGRIDNRFHMSTSAAGGNTWPLLRRDAAYLCRSNPHRNALIKETHNVVNCKSQLRATGAPFAPHPYTWP